MAILRIDHVGIAVKSLDLALDFWHDALGLRLAGTETVETEGVRVAFLPAGFALVGPVSEAIGISTTLWCSVATVLLTTGLMLAPRDVRELRPRPRGAAADGEALAA